MHGGEELVCGVSQKKRRIRATRGLLGAHSWAARPSLLQGTVGLATSPRHLPRGHRSPGRPAALNGSQTIAPELLMASSIC